MIVYLHFCRAIAVNYPARAFGIKRGMNPTEVGFSDDDNILKFRGFA